MTARDDYPIGHLGDASDDRTIGELLNIRSRMCDEIDQLREMVAAARGLCLRWLDEGPDGIDSLDAVDRICNYLLVDVD